ncbi:MAG: HAD family hydrolase [Victivallaceae bacterium]|nr:HAD family hydrolase [Victivallaceae bacterium]
MLIFDYDGVIADSLEYNLEITNRACALAAPKARSATVADLYELSSMSFDELARSIGVEPGEVPACLVEINRLLAIPNERTKLFDGMAEVIRKAAGQHRLAIVSHNTEIAIDHVLSMNSLRHYFSDILGTESPGDKTAQIIYLLEKYQVDGKQVYMVGDSVSDIISARLAGVNSIAVSWGFQPIVRLKPALPDFIVTNPEQLRIPMDEKLRYER